MTDAEMKKECRKPVDLTVLLDSGIEVYTHDAEGYGWMLISSKERWSALDLEDNEVRPRMNYWFCGLQFDDESIVDRLRTAGFEVEDRWDDHQREWVGFRILGLQDGYYWPWEANL